MGWRSGWNRRAERLGRLGPSGVLGVVEAWLTVAWVDAVVSWLPYRLWRSWLRSVPAGGSRASAPETERVASWIEIGANHYPRHVGCLQRALALRALLSHRGLSATVRIGVAREGQTIRAHAWVDHEGCVLNEAPDVAERYVPLERWTGTAPASAAGCVQHTGRRIT